MSSYTANNLNQYTFRTVPGTVRRRVRYWTDGLVIGSELFVREASARGHFPAAPPLFACRRLNPAR